MANVVILAVNAKYVHSSLSVWYLAGGVSRYAQSACDVKIIESTINQSGGEIAGKVADCRPDVVGISTYIWNAGKLPGLLMLLRESLPDAVFVLGGPEASYNAEYWLERGADYVLCGEGERSFPALLDSLAGGAVSLELIPGLCWRQGGRTCANPVSKQDGEWINPYGEAYFDALSGRIAYLETSRGCPFTCAFCLSGGSGVRFFDLNAAKEQLYKLSESGTQTVKLVDRTFNCDAGRAYELFEYIISLDTLCRFHFEVAADLFDERTLALLADAPSGRIQLEAGLQSFCQPALKASSRHTDLKKAESNIRTLLRNQNIHIHVDLIAGLPRETLPEFQDSFDRAYALGAHTLQLGFLKLLHGSKLRGQADNLGIVYGNEPPYEIISSPWLGAEDLRILKVTENALQHTYNKGRFLSTLEYVLSVSGLRPFSLFRALGEDAPNHGAHPEGYAGQLYKICVKLPGVDADTLRDKLTCDWLGMVKGKNMPHFLKNPDRRRRQVIEHAEKQLGRKIDHDEASALSSGKGAFVDSVSRNPVTGLYQLYFIDLG